MSHPTAPYGNRTPPPPGYCLAVVHAGAGNFTDVLYCLSPIKPNTADAPHSSSSSSSSQWHKLQVSGCGPGPLGWFATTATAAGNMVVHGGLGADNERRGDLFMLHMHE